MISQNDMLYYNKYIKYKNKYLKKRSLIEKKGGGFLCNVQNIVGYNYTAEFKKYLEEIVKVNKNHEKLVNFKEVDIVLSSTTDELYKTSFVYDAANKTFMINTFTLASVNGKRTNTHTELSVDIDKIDCDSIEKIKTEITNCLRST